jgi:hypothetical protein
VAIQVDDRIFYVDIDLVIFDCPENLIVPDGTLNGSFYGRIHSLYCAGSFSRIALLYTLLTPGKFIGSPCG